MSKIHIDPSKYVVLDVETNGLSSIKDDLLSISIYKPDTEEMYNRFLPLELNSEVVTTYINGIKTIDLQGLSPLSQNEVDEIIRNFELKQRTILIYSNLDEKFIVKYFQRHHLIGVEYFAFYNFKHDIISSSFSEGNITKDNLCKLYGIENIQKIHSGSNDCILEWKLFEKMNGHKLLITDVNVFEFNNEYIVPAGYIHTHKNLKYYLPNLPHITCESKEVFSLSIPANKIIKFPTNFNGMIDEHLINSMLHVQKIDSKAVLLDNKKKLKFIGKLPSNINVVPMIFNPDGTMTATREQDKKLVIDINSVIHSLKELISPLIDYIKNDIFNGKTINSQELMIYPDKKILALCDLSNEYAVLEIKTTPYLERYAEQLYYESNGRKCFILLTDWKYMPEKITYAIHEISFNVTDAVDYSIIRYENAKKKIETESIELLTFINATTPVELKCKKCGNKWKTSYNIAKQQRPCPNCTSKIVASKKTSKKHILTEEEKLLQEKNKLVQNFLKCQAKLEERSNHKLTLLSYKDSKSPAKAKCLSCGYEWQNRWDHLLDRHFCPNCKQGK